MIRKPLIVALTALTLTAGAIGLANADDKAPADSLRPAAEHRLDRMSERLGLSDEQRTKIEALMQQHNDPTVQRDANRRIFRELRDLDPKAENYQQRLDDLIGQAQKQLGDRLRTQAERRAAIDQVLTDAQRQKLADWEKQRGEHFHDRMARNHDGHWQHGKRHHDDCGGK